jgi:hypothetical protein
MLLLIDENMPAQLASGLRELIRPRLPDIEVYSIAEYFHQGVKDEDWIPEAGKLKAIVITQDYNIHRTRHLRDLYLDHGVGLFFFRPPSKTGFLYWEMVKKVVNMWEEMEKIIKKDYPPFAYRTSSRTQKFERFE